MLLNLPVDAEALQPAHYPSTVLRTYACMPNVPMHVMSTLCTTQIMVGALQ